MWLTWLTLWSINSWSVVVAAQMFIRSCWGPELFFQCPTAPSSCRVSTTSWKWPSAALADMTFQQDHFDSRFVAWVIPDGVTVNIPSCVCGMGLIHSILIQLPKSRCSWNIFHSKLPGLKRHLWHSPRWCDCGNVEVSDGGVRRVALSDRPVRLAALQMTWGMWMGGSYWHCFKTVKGQVVGGLTVWLG